MTAEELRAFSAEVADLFNAGKIPYPVHLDGGCEDQLLKVFETINRDDWLACSWRSHWRCLLHGVPKDVLLAEIMAGRSMTICLPQHRIISSAIVGGILPIALGIAYEIKRSGGTNKVVCFAGDMTARTGMMDECIRYGAGHRLPIRWIIEDNGKSVMTDTMSTWGDGKCDPDVKFVHYKLPWPHAGAGKRVQF